MVIAAVLAGIVVGAAGAWLLARTQYASKLGVLEDARGSLEMTLKALAADALASSNRSFLEIGRAHV